MKRTIAIVLFLTILTVVSGCGLGNSKDHNDEIKDLQDKVESLQSQLSESVTTQASESGDIISSTAEEPVTTAPSIQYTGVGKYRGLDISASCTDPSSISIKFENNSSDGYSLGWVDGPTITCITTDGEYYYKTTRATINAGDSYNLTAYFDNASGEIVSLYIDNVNALTSSGLPSDMNGGDRVEIAFSSGNENAKQPSEENISNESAAVIKTGSGSFQNLEISVTASDAQSVTVEYINNSSEGYSLGWVNGPTITCTTTEGEFYFAGTMAKIEAGKSLKENYYFDNATGDIISITISGFYSLGGTGLPDSFGGGEYVTIALGE